jgi:hypothetical protein
MTAFPIFNKLSTTGYGLYPGTKQKPDLDVEFQAGLTLVLGANGLGKTTLVTLLYRMCSGPYDIPRLAGAGGLGGIKLDTRKLPAPDRRIFADRVNDGAATATATLQFVLGEVEIVVKRSLANLELLQLTVSGVEASASEEGYQALITEHARVNRFSDWILILRHLTFYFEDRRALVWDPSAQRQLLRMLFLAPGSSAEWTDAERDVLQRDSAMRNLNDVLTKEKRNLAQAEDVAASDGDLQEELGALEKLQAVDQPRLDDMNDQVGVLAAAREAARLETLKAESEHESAYRNLERLQLQTVASAFPGSGDTARYLMAKLVSDQECLACGSRSPKTATTLQQRIAKHRCVVCNSIVDQPPGRAKGSRGIDRAAKDLQKASTRLSAATELRVQAEAELEQSLVEIQALNARTADRSARIEALARRLPPSEVELHERRRELAAMGARLESMRRELQTRRESFRRLIARTSREIVARKEDVQTAFDEFAKGFLLEQCTLAWAPHKDRIGETGRTIDFPAFELEMGGADFPSPVRRSGPQQVSESQREFIDLAFRMALIRVAGNGGVGSIVIDAPESSLDAVFVTRAADVLIRYASDAENRLVITSNLVEGDLIPELMRKGGISSASSRRIVDLLKVAAPTMATRVLKKDYEEVRKKLFQRASR